MTASLIRENSDWPQRLRGIVRHPGLIAALILLLPLLVPPDTRFDYNLWTVNAIMTLSVVAITGASGQV
jgi:protein-S-isoprenylcysteine O-methyltransferase Ste14